MDKKIPKRDVLIIEDSVAVGIVLQDFLKNLGYHYIHSCKTGKSGISTFKDLVESNKNPIVFLDYYLPDMDCMSVLTQILEIRSDAKVILETAAERTEEGVKHLIRYGVYNYLSKPIRYENLKKIIEVIEEESHFFEREEEMIEILKKAEEEIRQQIEFLLKTYSRISVERIVEFTKISHKEILPLIDELKAKGEIISLDDIKEISCNQCGSLKISQLFYCPFCKSSNFNLSKLIEHYSCGNVSEESSYENSICSKCKKEIKVIGVDYRILENYYICNDCSEKFPELSFHFFCLNCESKMALEEAKWKESSCYKVVSKN